MFKTLGRAAEKQRGPSVCLCLCLNLTQILSTAPPPRHPQPPQNEPKTPPGRPQDTPKRPQDAHQTAPSRPQNDKTQDNPRRPQDNPLIRPKSTPRRPKNPPKTPPNTPLKPLQDGHPKGSILGPPMGVKNLEKPKEKLIFSEIRRHPPRGGIPSPSPPRTPPLVFSISSLFLS